MNNEFQKPNLFKLSLYLFRHYFFSSKSISLIKIVSLICVSGLALSVFSLVLILSVMGGFGQSIKKRLLEKEPHLVLTFKEPLKNNLHFLPKDLQEGIKSQIPFETQEVIIKTKNHFLGVIAKGYPQEKLKNDMSLYQIHTFNNDDMNSKKSNQILGSVFISPQLSSLLNVFEGDKITLLPTLSLLLPPSEAPPFKTVKIHSILDKDSKTNTKLSLSYQKENLHFQDFSHIQHGLEIKLKDPDSYPLYMDYLKKYKVQSWAERNSSLFFALKLEKIVMVLLIILALIISFLGIASDLFLLITQKQKDMGILQAIGLSPKEITKVFTQLGFLLSLVGISLGLFLGIGTSLLLKYNNFPILPAVYQDRTLPTLILPLTYSFIALGTLFVAWIVCYLPTRYLSRMPISQFLRTSNR